MAPMLVLVIVRHSSRLIILSYHVNDKGRIIYCILFFTLTINYLWLIFSFFYLLFIATKIFNIITCHEIFLTVCLQNSYRYWKGFEVDSLSLLRFPLVPAQEESVATFKGNEFFSYDLSHTPIQSSTDEITLAFRTLQRNGLLLHTGKSVDYVNLSLKSGAVYLVINLGSGAFEAMVSPAEGKFNDNAWHEVRVSRNLRQVSASGPPGSRLKNDCQIQRVGREGCWGCGCCGLI